MPATLYDLIPREENPGNDVLLGRFLDYVEGRRLQLYAAQESAILEVFEDKNVILNTPTGSGKSLVASALHFKSIAQGKRSVYTCPIKALVNEKFFDLCRIFGPENVGMMTGDGAVNLSDLSILAANYGGTIGGVSALAVYGSASLMLRCPQCRWPLFNKGPIWFPWPNRRCWQCKFDTHLAISSR